MQFRLERRDPDFGHRPVFQPFVPKVAHKAAEKLKERGKKRQH